jgi:hypothetical protein
MRTARFNVHKFCLLSTLYRYVFCVDLRTNGDYFSMLLYLIGSYKTVTKCVCSVVGNL